MMTEYDMHNDGPQGPIRIGKSKFFFGVWYKITNERALVPIGHCGNGWSMDHETAPSTYYVGDYSREKFNSVKFGLSIHNQTGLFDRGKEPSYLVSVLCFADTRDCGAETIVSLTVKDLENIDPRFFDYAAKVLSKSGAVVDVDLNNDAIHRIDGFIEKLAKVKQSLEQIVREG